MASPVYAAMPTAGSLLAAFTLAASGSIGAFVDATAVFQSDIAYLDKTVGTAAATSGVACSAYYAYAQTTITAALSAAGTSASVTSRSKAASFAPRTARLRARPCTAIARFVI